MPTVEPPGRGLGGAPGRRAIVEHSPRRDGRHVDRHHPQLLAGDDGPALKDAVDKIDGRRGVERHTDAIAELLTEALDHLTDAP